MTEKIKPTIYLNNRNRLHKYLMKFDSWVFQLFVAICDVLLLSGSLLFALWFKFEEQPLSWIINDYIISQWQPILLSLFIYMLLLFVFRMYRYAWRYAGFEAAFSLYWASIIGTLALHMIVGTFGVNPFPNAVIVIFWLISVIAIGSLRIGLRVFIRYTQENWQDSVISNGKSSKRLRAIIVGNIEHNAAILKTMGLSPDLKHYEIIGMFGDKTDKIGFFYSGVRVLGVFADLIDYLQMHSITQALFVLSDQNDSNKMREMVLWCRQHNVQVKVIPNFVDIVNKSTQARVEDIQVEDLLRRSPRDLDLKLHSSYILGKTILITGAGGSIGSEICRQVMKCAPSDIILLGHGENSIFTIQQELRRKYPAMTNHIICVIASITNKERINRIIKKFKPDVVFHAAAHKHLPLMEDNVCEAVYNNVIGTRNIVKACVDNCVKSMIQISTDKAAEPSSVMGATKWICEEILRANAQIHKDINFICVRFGNVLGSRGSVIPVFTEQIKNGGPVTVTHPEMTRYFMTIPEAVRLVIQAGAVGISGSTYLLDMGQPVKILDLAEDMIRLNGYKPYEDIQITFTGIRPGEKMHEQLASNEETVETTGYEGLNRVVFNETPIYDKTISYIEKLELLAAKLDGESILAFFESDIPGYSNLYRTKSE